MTILDTSLVQDSSVANASLNGQLFRLNPTSVSLPYTAKVTQTKTLGGMVVQVFGITLGDLEITGTFGAGGFIEQEAFLERMMTEGQSQAQMVIGQPMAPPVRFLFPLLGYDFNVYLKQYTSPQGAAIVRANEIIAPEWTLILVIDNDNTNLIQQQTDSYISRLASGLGYQINQFNGPDTGDTSYLQSVISKDGGPVGFLNTYYGAQVNTAASSNTGASGAAAASGGSAGNVSGNPSGQTDWAKMLLQDMNCPTSQNNINNVADWEQSESGSTGWPPARNNPLNSSIGTSAGDGTGSYPDLQTAAHQDALQIMPQSAGGQDTGGKYDAIYNALLQDAPYDTFKAAVVASPWASSHYDGGSTFSSSHQ